MAFDNKRSGPRDPTYKQITNVSILDGVYNDVAKVLMSVSNSHPEMKVILQGIEQLVFEAKKWVMSN